MKQQTCSALPFSIPVRSGSHSRRSAARGQGEWAGGAVIHRPRSSQVNTYVHVVILGSLFDPDPEKEAVPQKEAVQPYSFILRVKTRVWLQETTHSQIFAMHAMFT